MRLLTAIEVLADPSIFAFAKDELAKVGIFSKANWEGVIGAMAGHRRVRKEFLQIFGKLCMVGDAEGSSSTLRKKKIPEGGKSLELRAGEVFCRIVRQPDELRLRKEKVIKAHHNVRKGTCAQPFSRRRRHMRLSIRRVARAVPIFGNVDRNQ